MPEVQEVSMEDYAKARSAGETPVLPAATTPQEKVENAPASATGTPESEEEKKAKGGGWQRRIDKLTKRGTELEESLQTEREARQRLEAKLAGRDPAELPKKETATEPGARPKPKQSDAKYAKMGDEAFDAYIEDLGRWAAAEETGKLKTELTNEQKQAQEKTQAAQREQILNDNLLKKSEAAIKNHPDFNDVVFGEEFDGAKLVAGSVIDSFILDPENEGMEVLYHLCKNHGEIERISKLSPQKQIRELGKIEESLNIAKEETTSSPEPKKAALPTPIKPVQGGTSKSTVKPENMSMEDYANWRKNGSR